ncbi:radical SAM family heme chaperone HemW [Dokdonia sp. Hel_I_53]|uniref:radical SAM family heme chaperone HemW n=1 Tax=Dokdonia sp. Hel_I_53 TaxID=1566287 RepID=UPI00119B9657|nr:radical SAM family heme chaperone HemW [Dokdonia sp. Hel_I_53]TVZ52884.1 oxygen-independent coproporphyrinogen-3 oxidase [Dokdonia sp. Hel_I_53]
MSSLYIHIPFCKQACHYCDFHFSTTMGKKEEMIAAIIRELELRKDEFEGEEVSNIYFGGGTPSVLDTEEINQIIDACYKNYNIQEDPEITLEANPDDLTEIKINQLAASRINRLSIGVQSFFEQDLKLMNRAHNAQEAIDCITLSRKRFPNSSLDLIYGIPEMSMERWEQNIDTALSLGVPHISAYALTVEPKTALENFIKKGIVPPVQDEVAQEHHALLIKKMEAEGYENYEFSNFALPGYHSKNNTAYWQGKKYIGIGPSAHSYDGKRRAWNINNNPKFIKAITAGELPQEVEKLTLTDSYNEYVMTRLRTKYGVSLNEINSLFGAKFKNYFLEHSKKHLDEHLLFREEDRVYVSRKGKFLSDGIASDLFLLNLG